MRKKGVPAASVTGVDTADTIECPDPARDRAAAEEFLVPLHKQHAHLTRITRRLRALQIGERVSVELTLELTRRCDAFDILEEVIERFGNVDPEALAAAGGDRFPPTPIHFVVGSRQ